MDFETEKGATLRLTGISPALVDRLVSEVESRFRKEGEPVDAPTYQLKTVGGDLQTFALTEKALNPQDPDEAELRQARWAAYQTALANLIEAQSEARMKFLFTWAVGVDMPKDDSWQRLVKAAGVEIPTDPDELRFTYLWYYLLTPFEVQSVYAELQMIAYGKAVSDDDVKSFRKGLQDSVWRAAREVIGRAVSGVEPETTEAAPDTGLLQPETTGRPGGTVVELDAVPVG